MASWNRVDFDGVLGEARVAQRSGRFRLPVVEDRLGGVGFGEVRRKCMSSVSISSC
jgi:hypothetical protein